MQLSTKVPTIMLFVAMSLASSLRAFTQMQSLPDDPSMERAEKIPKWDFRYLASEAYLAGGTVVDMRTTIDGLDHPTNAYTTSGKFLMQYTVRENGWAAFLGNRNTFGVVSANVLLNTGFDLLDRRLYRRGGRWRIMAISLNVAKATGNWVDGFHNMRVLGNVDRAVALQTGYHGTIIWSR
jgi:hypothetical protein